MTYHITFGYGKDAVTLQETGDAILATLKRLKSEGWETDKVSKITTALEVEGQVFIVTVSDASGWGYYATADDFYDGTNQSFTAHDFHTPEGALEVLKEQLSELILEGRI